MKIPEPPPIAVAVFKAYPQEMLKAMVDPEVQAFLTKEEQEYNYWDKFRHLSMPGGFQPEVIWACREMQRTGKQTLTPIKNGDTGCFGYTLTAAIERTLHNTDRNMPLLTEDLPAGHGRDAILVRSLMEEAIASSQIEGAAATRRVAKEMLASNKKPADKAEQMILNNYAAINHIRALKDKPLSLEMLLELHRILAEKTLETAETGRFRQSPVDDNVEVIDSDGTVLYRPPKGELVEGMLTELVNFANSDDGPFIHPLVKGVLLHFWLAWIHPFCDGNGRTARAIFYWYMLRKKYWVFEYLSISRIVLNKEGQYKRAFISTELTGDLTYFLLFNARIINEAAEEVSAYLRRRLDKERAAGELLAKFPELNRRQREIVAHARTHPRQVYTIGHHRGQNNISYATARADLLGLVAAGLFTAVISSKTHEFLPVAEKIS